MKINILGTNYKVKFVEEIDGTDHIVGQFLPKEKQILINKYIDNHWSKGGFLETIIHEVLHALNYESGYWKEKIDCDSEPYVTQTAKQLALLMPKIFEIERKLLEQE